MHIFDKILKWEMGAKVFFAPQCGLGGPCSVRGQPHTMCNGHGALGPTVGTCTWGGACTHHNLKFNKCMGGCGGAMAPHGHVKWPMQALWWPNTWWVAWGGPPHGCTPCTTPPTQAPPHMFASLGGGGGGHGWVRWCKGHNAPPLAPTTMGHPNRLCGIGLAPTVAIVLCCTTFHQS